MTARWYKKVKKTVNKYAGAPTYVRRAQAEHLRSQKFTAVQAGKLIAMAILISEGRQTEGFDILFLPLRSQ